MANNPKPKYLIVDGYIKWARLREEDKDTKFQEHGQYNAEFYPETQQELDKIVKEVTSRDKEINPKTPHDGVAYGVGKWVKVSRNHVHHKIEEFGGTPPVVKMDGETVAGDWDWDEDGVLGNGTKVRVKLVCYGSGRMSGMRLEKVGVLEHVPYDPEMQEASGF